MRAIQITEFGRPEDVVRVVDVPEPPAPGPGEVTVAVELSPLNKHDLLPAGGCSRCRRGAPSSSRCLAAIRPRPG